MSQVRPTIFLGVPRVWEKIEAKMKSMGAQTTGTKAKIAKWAKQKGLAKSHAEQQGTKGPGKFWLANKYVSRW